jgi:Zn-finger domain-containing protein
MKNLIMIMLFAFVFSIQSFAVEKVAETKANVCINQESSDIVAYEGVSFDCLNSVNVVENFIDYESAMINRVIEEKTKEKKTYLRKGRNVDYSILDIDNSTSNNKTVGFDYSMNKLLMQS